MLIRPMPDSISRTGRTTGSSCAPRQRRIRCADPEGAEEPERRAPDRRDVLGAAAHDDVRLEGRDVTGRQDRDARRGRRGARAGLAARAAAGRRGPRPPSASRRPGRRRDRVPGPSLVGAPEERHGRPPAAPAGCRTSSAAARARRRWPGVRKVDDRPRLAIVRVELRQPSPRRQPQAEEHDGAEQARRPSISRLAVRRDRRAASPGNAGSPGALTMRIRVPRPWRFRRRALRRCAPAAPCRLRGSSPHSRSRRSDRRRRCSPDSRRAPFRAAAGAARRRGSGRCARLAVARRR